MSVNPQIRPRTKSNYRHSSDLSLSIESTQHSEVINSVNNLLQFHRKLIESCGLHLSGFCSINDKKIINNEKNLSTENLGVQQYLIEIEGQNLYITKSQVKHTFSLEKFLLESGEFLRFEFCEFSSLIITNFTLANRSTKLILISDLNELSKNLANFISIKPIELIENNIKLRMSKLNKSVSKSFNVVSQSNGKLNFEWRKQNDDSMDNACLKSSIKFENRTSSISRASDIKANNNKKIIEKKIRENPKSLNKSMENFNETLKGSFLEQKNRSYLNSTKKSKLINCSYVEPKREKSKDKLFESSKKSKEPNGDEISSSSLYTTKKDMKKEMEIPTRVGANKTFNTINKENKFSENSFDCSSVKKPTYTQSKQSLLNSVNLSTSVRMSTKTFGKNISQAKIAQVSRPLLQLKE